jgi:hypothetical protein
VAPGVDLALITALMMQRVKLDEDARRANQQANAQNNNNMNM